MYVEGPYGAFGKYSSGHNGVHPGGEGRERWGTYPVNFNTVMMTGV